MPGRIADTLQRRKHARRCRKLAAACSEPVLADYLDTCAAMNIGDIVETPMIAVDLELTGLDKAQDQIIAMGWVLIDNGRIKMGSARHLLINADRTVGSSAAIHELMDSEISAGESVETGLETLFAEARGRVWIFHHAGLDVSFLKSACGRWADTRPGFVVLDTMRIEYRLRRRREIPVKQGDLQLGRIRETYGLPSYSAHDAQIDALAAAELFLAIAARMEPDSPLELRPHLKFF